MSSSPRARTARKSEKKKEPFALHRALPSFFRPSAMDLVLFSRQLAVFVLPSMAGLFKEFDTELPLPTQIVLATAAFARDYGIASIFGLMAFGLLAFLFSRTRPGGRVFDRITLAIPVVGGIARDAIVERTTRTLGTLLAAGVPLVKAVELVRDTTGNSVYRAHLENVRLHLLEGEGFAEPFAANRLFPPLVRQMARVGERTGTLDQFMRE